MTGVGSKSVRLPFPPLSLDRWAAYEAPDPKNTEELKLVGKYLEIDVKATWMIHRWLKNSEV